MNARHSACRRFLGLWSGFLVISPSRLIFRERVFSKVRYTDFPISTSPKSGGFTRMATSAVSAPLVSEPPVAKDFHLIKEGQVPAKIDVPNVEKSIINYWREINAFKRSEEVSKCQKNYNFYDGPPFATGLPHYGHILAGTVKDIVGRYSTMMGMYTRRTFGWDTHGLPIEHLVEKQLGLKSAADIRNYGISNFNEQCRSAVMRCEKQWEETVERMGRWVDFKNGYKTMDLSFMETVWWCFKQIYDSGNVYHSYEIMAYSTGACTTLSNFEVSLNYVETEDYSIIVSFKLIDSDEYLLAWTTTPWTIVSNMALCVNPERTYVKVIDNKNGKAWIFMKNRLSHVYPGKNPEDKCKIVEEFEGEALLGKKYIPPFDFFTKTKKDRGFKVIGSDTLVSDDAGTGIVHMAPAHGEQDFEACIKNNVIDRGECISDHIGEGGKFTKVISKYENMYFKDSEKHIVEDLKKSGSLVSQGRIKHNYPFCWRTNTPIMYLAMPSWFIRVENIRDLMVQNLKDSHWVPEHVGQRRFLNWVANAKDWNVSRTRFWGTPIPIWISEDGEEKVVVGSIKELEELSGVKGLTDLHSHHLDKIKIPSRKGKGMLSRVVHVFDCWFESGSMPFAQFHYPFEKKDTFSNIFPADFISEGVDQTRGWFYTLLVISTHITKKAPYKNVVVVGHVLAEDGKKMSKSKGNYPEPAHMINKYGADAIRLYLVNSSILRGEDTRFVESELKEISSRIIFPWINAFRFFSSQVAFIRKFNNIEFKYNPDLDYKSCGNETDLWLLSTIQDTVDRYINNMKDYTMYNIVPLFANRVEDITNWYIRLNRRRLKGEQGPEASLCSINVLFEVLFTFCTSMAPYSPFISEFIYLNLKPYALDYLKSLNLKDDRSVHFLPFPSPKRDLIDQNSVNAFECLKNVINLTRLTRESNEIPLKTPCRALTVISRNTDDLQAVKSLSNYLKEESNVKELLFCSNELECNIRLRLEPNYKAIGKKYKSSIKDLKQAVNKATDSDAEAIAEGRTVVIDGFELNTESVSIFREISQNSGPLKMRFNKRFAIVLDTTEDEGLLLEALVRGLVHRLQKLRRTAGLVQTDEVLYVYKVIKGDAGLIPRSMENHGDYFRKTLNRSLIKYDQSLEKKKVISSEVEALDGVKVELFLFQI